MADHHPVTGDATDLVERARGVLHRPQQVRLDVEGPGEDGPELSGVELTDHGGVPVLVCDPDSPVTRAARDRLAAVLSVVHADGTTVVLRGRLSPLCADVLEGRPVELVELALSEVCLNGDRLDLQDYLREPEEVVGAYAEEVRIHANRDQGDHLREVAARLSGCAEEEIAGGFLRGLDADGVLLAWVDATGSHEVRILFPTAAVSRRQLSAMLSKVACTHDA